MSSVSSGGSTTRPGAGSGRSSSNHTFLARFKSNPPDSDEEAGPSDYYKRPKSDGSDSPTPAWRELSVEQFDVEDGPSDSWPPTPQPWQNDEEEMPTPESWQNDEEEFGRIQPQPYLHPSVSRLRSHQRTVSSSTQQTSRDRLPRSPSLFSQVSTSSSVSRDPAFTFHPMRGLSATVFQRQPTVMEVRGLIAVGTQSGQTLIFNFAQELKHTLPSTSPVTCVAVSSDSTYIATGHASGQIHLWDLSRPAKPARSTQPLSQKEIGRKEGHLAGTKITHLGFIGSRHTSIVSGDAGGRAFWWSLGKVVGVESYDVIRILGNYDKTTELCAASPLPSGTLVDEIHLCALSTPSKLVIIGLKPSAKTWYRRMNSEKKRGCLDWLPSPEPILAYSTGPSVRLLHVKPGPDFVAGSMWSAADAIKSLQWYDETHLLLLTDAEIILLNTTSMAPVEQSSLQTQRVSSVRAYREKLFLLTKSNLQVGTLLHWNDRILAKVHQGDFLGAIHLALSYHDNKAAGNRVGLEGPKQVRERIRSLVQASLDWAFSEDRMRDDTHYSADGRGVDLTSLFEGLASACIDACIALSDMDFLFDDVYERYANAGIQNIFLGILEPHLFTGLALPPNIVQSLISMHESRNEFRQAEAVIWNANPLMLDINQAVTLCEKHGLWDALIHVYTRAMRDYVAPLTLLHEQPTLVLAYLEHALCGLAHPSGEPLAPDEAELARSTLYDQLFLQQKDLDTLLQYDSEAFLHILDIAFEDSWLNEAAISRQTIVNILLTFDLPFVHIFAARNLPKYPQFIRLPPTTLDWILRSLAEDNVAREDRQFAAEFLLSAYVPHDLEELLALFKSAGFYRLLRGFYRRDKQWPALLDCYLSDPELDASAFEELDDFPLEENRLAQSLPRLLDISVTDTARMIDRRSPSLHDQALDALSPSLQLEYLQSLAPIPRPNLYVQLLLNLEPSRILPYLETAPAVDLAQVVEDCAESNFYEGQLWALDEQGKEQEAFALVTDLLRAQDDLTTPETMDSIQRIARMAIKLCQKHQSEELWYSVLSELIDLHRSGAPLRELIQEALGPLVASSVSFPKLFKRLVESAAPSKGDYAEFRIILTSMLDSYRTEGDLLSVTTQLLQGDLFFAVEELVRKRRSGWTGNAVGEIYSYA